MKRNYGFNARPAPSEAWAKLIVALGLITAGLAIIVMGIIAYA